MHVEEPQIVPTTGQDLSESLDQSVEEQARFEHDAKKKKGKMISKEEDEKVNAGLLP